VQSEGCAWSLYSSLFYLLLVLSFNHHDLNQNSETNEEDDPLRMSTSLASNKEGFLGFASGLVAGVIGVLTGYPLDTLKVCSRKVITLNLLLLCRSVYLHFMRSL